MKKTAITFGDPNSISPEITIKALNFLDLPKENVILITSSDILNFYKEKYDLYLEKSFEIEEIPYKKEYMNIGAETEEGGEFAFKSLVKACELAQNHKADAIVTAPISKNALKLAGHDYSGQTEILEQYLAHNNQKAEMLFIGERFSVFLMTRHIALKDVAENIKKDIIIEKIKRLKQSYEKQLNKINPKFAICSLNPHASEKGMFGIEEALEIEPAVRELREFGIHIDGPYPSDSLFENAYNNDNFDYDCYIANYHDQALIPIKLMERNTCVNTTIGLDILRTSPAHGTAYDIAGKNIANAESMINAIKLALL